MSFATRKNSSNLMVGVVAVVAAASPAQAADRYEYGVCQVSRPDSGADIRPVYDANSYLFHYHKEDLRDKEFSPNGDGVKVTMIKAPTYGEVVLEDGEWSSPTDYEYWPKAGYVGRDRFVMEVEKQGVKVRIQYLIEGIPADERTDGQCATEHWKVSSASQSGAAQQSAAPERADARRVS